MRVPRIPTVLKLPACDLCRYRRDAVQHRQRRDRLELADAEVTAHGRDGGSLRPGRRQAADQGGEDVGLLARVAVGQISRHLAHVGVHDGDIQSRVGERMSIDQTPVVELGRGRPNAADQPDVHRYPLPGHPPISWSNTFGCVNRGASSAAPPRHRACSAGAAAGRRPQGRPARRRRSPAGPAACGRTWHRGW